MKRLLTLLTLCVATVVLGTASKALAEGCVSTSDGSGIQTQTLYAGQTIDAGTVTVQVVNNNLEVTYATTGGWEIVETHLWVGDDLTNMPQTRKGNPKVGNFPYHSDDITGATSYTTSIPLAVLGFSCPTADSTYYIAAHAALRKSNGSGGYQTETGWADGDRFVDRGAWGTFFTIVLTCDCNGGGGGGGGNCETAFSYDSYYATCFLDIDEDGDGTGDFNRWGWTNGALVSGVYVHDIYAGAGQCDLSKGTLVGTMEVNYNGVNAIVTYSMNAPYVMDETQLYVGNEILARDVNGEFTVAPGQYPYIHDSLGGVTSDSYTVDASDNINVVAHATVCGFPD